MRVKCERDGTIFSPKPAIYPSDSGSMSEEWCKEEDFKHPCRVINCPTCGRGYFQHTDGSWQSDRPLTIIEEETDDQNYESK